MLWPPYWMIGIPKCLFCSVYCMLVHGKCSLCGSLGSVCCVAGIWSWLTSLILLTYYVSSYSRAMCVFVVRLLRLYYYVWCVHSLKWPSTSACWWGELAGWLLHSGMVAAAVSDHRWHSKVQHTHNCVQKLLTQRHTTDHIITHK